MEVKQNSFYITLFSDSSIDNCPDNTPASFTVRLAVPLDLGSTSLWKVGLCEIRYNPPQRTVVQGAVLDVVSALNVLIYCDKVKPQLVVSEISRLLRAIICPSQLGKHLFPNIYFLPWETNVIQHIIIDMRIWGQQSDLVFLADDNIAPTNLVLHFRRVKWEVVP